jgi:indole-3-glycerol phosphate synthase
MLNTIVSARKRSLTKEKEELPLEELLKLDANFKGQSLKAALKKEGLSLIAEIKKASPSHGLISQVADIAAVAKVYEQSGARAISVLTEPTFFQGSFNYLKIVKENSNLPVLAKDFIIDPYQIYRAKYEGADAVLLMAQLLTQEQMDSFTKLAHSLNLEVLAEASSKAELKKVLASPADIIGINSRNFNNLKINFNKAVKLLEELTDPRPKVFESGINSAAEVKLLEKKGADGMLVGTSLMASKDIAKKIASLLGKEEE